MTTLHATAIISAVDRASAVFHRVGAAAQAQAGRFQAAVGAANRFASTAGTVVGAGGLLAASMSVEGEKALDYTTRLMQSAGELSAAQREALKGSALESSIKTGVKALELVEAQKEAIQGGIDADTAIAMTEVFAKVARANAIPAKMVAEDAINVSNSLGFAMGNTEEKVASLRRSMELMSVMPNLSTETWQGLRESLKHAAPAATNLKIPVEQLGAALAILADAGFKSEMGGTALRTILTRAIAPTRQARLELRAFGIDLEQLYKFDPNRLGDTKALGERLRAAGLGQGVDLDKSLAPLRDPSRFKGVYHWQDKAQEILSRSLGIKKGDAEARGILNKVISGHVSAANSGFDLDRYFKGIAKLPLQAMREMFGIQRVSQAIKLRDEINKILKLPTGERLSKFQMLAQEFERLMRGSIDRRAEPVMEGFAFAVDRAAAAFTRLRSAIFDSGIGNSLAGTLDRVAGSVERLSKTNPTLLRDITYALGGLALLGPAAWAVRSTAAGLAMIANTAARLGASRLVLAGGLGALIMGDIGKVFDPVTYSPFGDPITPYDQLKTALGGFAGEVAGGMGDIGNAVNSAYIELKQLFGFDGKNSLLLDSINLVVKALELGTASIRYWRESVPKILEGQVGELKPPGEEGDWIRKAWERANRGVFDKLRMPAPQSQGQPQKFIGDVRSPRVDVQGEANVKVQNEVTIRIEGPGQVVDQRGGSGEARVPLNVGKSMPDTGGVTGGSF